MKTTKSPQDPRAEAMRKSNYVQGLSLIDEEVERFLPRRCVMGSRLFMSRKGANAGFHDDFPEIKPTRHEWGLGWVTHANASVEVGQITQPASLRIRDSEGRYLDLPEKPNRETWSPAGYKAEWSAPKGLVISEQLGLKKDVLLNVIRFSNPGTEPQRLKLSVMGYVTGRAKQKREDRAWKVGWNAATGLLSIEADYPRASERLHEAARKSCSLLAVHGDIAPGDPFFAGSRVQLEIRQGKLRFDEDTPNGRAEWAYEFPMDIRLRPGESKQITLAYTVYPNREMASSAMADALDKSEYWHFLAEQEWNDYLGHAAPKFESDNSDYVRLYYWNWYADRANRVEYIDHPQIPKPVVVDDKFRYLHFQATGCYARRLQMERWLTDDTCKNGLEVLLASQRPDGNCGILSDTPGAEGGMYTEMPLLTAAVWAHFEATWDRKFLKSALPTLVKYDNFFRDNRGEDNGLIRVLGMGEIGTYDDSPRCYEMGAKRWFDWNFGNQPAEPVDVNSVIYLQRRLIAKMAELVGDADTQAEFEKRAAAIKTRIEKTMWDGDRSLYTDLHGPDHKMVQAKTPAMFSPLRAGVASPARARQIIRKHLLNPKEFWGDKPMPIPSLSYDDLSYDPNVRSACASRGEISIDLVWDAITALANYGEDARASELTDRTVRMMTRDGIPTSGERYAPDGRPLGGQLYGWANLINDAIITRVLGIRPDPESETVTFSPSPPSDMRKFSLRGVRIGDTKLSFYYECNDESAVLKVENEGKHDCRVTMESREYVLAPGQSVQAARGGTGKAIEES